MTPSVENMEKKYDPNKLTYKMFYKVMLIFFTWIMLPFIQEVL